MVNFDFKIDVLPNSRRQIVELVAGDPFSAQKGVAAELRDGLYRDDGLSATPMLKVPP